MDSERILAESVKGTQSSLIVINSDMSLGKAKIFFTHELYHLYYDEVKKSSVSFILIGRRR